MRWGAVGGLARSLGRSSTKRSPSPLFPVLQYKIPSQILPPKILTQIPLTKGLSPKTHLPYKIWCCHRTVSNQPKSAVRSITLCLSCRIALNRSPRELSRLPDLFWSCLRPDWSRIRPAFQPSRSHVWSSIDVTAQYCRHPTHSTPPPPPPPQIHPPLR